jgi:transcriptional regulator
MGLKQLGTESRSHRKAAADHLRKSRKAITAAEKASETRIAKSYKTLADNQDWLDDERAKSARREAGHLK